VHVSSHLPCVRAGHRRPHRGRRGCRQGGALRTVPRRWAHVGRRRRREPSVRWGAATVRRRGHCTRDAQQV